MQNLKATFSTGLGSISSMFATQDFSLGNSFSTSLSNDRKALMAFQKELVNGHTKTEAYSKTMLGASSAAQKFAQESDTTVLSIQGFVKQQTLAQVSNVATNKSFANCKSLIDEYNTGMYTAGNVTTTAGVTQTEFASAVGVSNQGLGTYLTKLNGAKGSLGGYIASLVGAKAATVALRVATLALNMAITMGVSFLITEAISAIQSYINKAEELSDTVDEVVNSYESAKQTLESTKSTLESLTDDYEELSKGVNSLNENVSLSDDDYEEYLDICNQIADLLPDLVQGYDAEGNAILIVKGDVEALTQAYYDLLEAENATLLSSGKDIFEDFKNDAEDLDTSNLSNTDITTSTIEILEKVLNSADTNEAVRKYISSSKSVTSQIVAALEEQGLEQGVKETDEHFIERAIKENKGTVNTIVTEFQTQMETATENMQNLAEAYIENAFLSGDYAYITDDVEAIINSIVSGFDYDFYNKFDSVNDFYTYLSFMLDKYNNLSNEDQNTLTLGINASTQFNNGEISYDEFRERIAAARLLYDDLDIESQAQLDLILDDSEYQEKIEKLSEGQDEEYIAELKGMTADEIDEAYDELFEVVLTAQEQFEAAYNNYKAALMGEDDLLTDVSKAIKLEGSDERQEKLDDFTKWYNSLSDRDKQFVYEISLDTDTAEWELSDWKDALVDAQQEAYDAVMTSAGSTIVDMDTKLSGTFDTLQEAYEDLFNGSNLDLENADIIGICNDVKSEFDDLADSIGTVDYTSYQNFVKVLTDSESTAEDVKNAIQEVAEYVTKASIDGTQDFQVLVSTLEQLGVDNAAVIAFQELISNEEALEACGIDLTDMTDLETEAFVREMVGAENLEQALAMLNMQKMLTSDSDLTTSEEVDTLIQYAKEAGVTEETLEELYNVRSALSKQEGHYYFLITDEEQESLENYSDTLEDMLSGDVLTEIDWESWGEEAGSDFSSGFASSFESILTTLKSNGNIVNGTALLQLDADDIFSTIDDIKSLADELEVEIDVENLLTTENLTSAVNELAEAYADAYIEEMNLSDDDLAQALKKAVVAAIDAKSSVESLSDSLQDLQANYQTLKEASDLYNESGYITIDQLIDLIEMDDQYVACLIDENGQLKLNSESYIALAKVKLEEARATATEEYQARMAEIQAESLARANQDVAESIGDSASGLIASIKAATESYSVFETQIYGVAKANLTAIQSLEAMQEALSGDTDSADDTVNLLLSSNSYSSALDEQALADAEEAEKAYQARLAAIDAAYAGLSSNLDDVLGYSSSFSSSSTSTDTSKKIDYIEIALDRASRAVENLGNTFSSTFKTISTRLSASNKEISAITDEISAQEKAYAAYMKAANSVSLSSSIKSMVRNGSYNITEYDSDTAELISQYKEYYEAALSCADAIDELKESLGELYQEQFNLIVTKWEENLQSLEHTANQIESRISQRTDAASDYVSTSQSQSASKSNIKDYKSLISNANSQISKLESEIDELQSYLDSAVASGYIAKYSEAYYDMLEQIQSAEEEIDSLNEEIIGYTNDIAEEYENIFDSIAQEYENAMSMIESEVNLINELINQAEAKGLLESKTYYEELMKLEEENISQLEDELADLQAALKNALNSGAIEEGSQAFYDMQDSINSVVEELAEANTELLELSNNIRQIEWDNFDYLQDQISVLTDEADFLIDLLESADLYTDNGQLTDEGLSVMGLHAQNYNVYMNQADQYAEEMAEIQALMEDDPYNTDLIERYQELLGLQQDMILAAEEEKDAIIDLVEEGIETELDALQDLIDSYTDALDSAKDYRN